MSKQIFYKIARIGEEIRSAKPLKVEFNALGELKGYQSTIQSASDKASGQLDAAITALRAAQKAAETAVKQASANRRIAEQLGVDVGQFNGYEKQFLASRDSFESAIAAIARIQNNI